MQERKRKSSKTDSKERAPRTIPLDGTFFKLVEAIDKRDQSLWFIFGDYELQAQTKGLKEKKWSNEDIKITAFVDPKDGEGYMLGHTDGSLLPLGVKVEPILLGRIKSLARKNKVKLTPLFSVYQRQDY